MILLAVGRPRLRAFTRRQWIPIVLLAGVFAAMNVSLYSAVARVGLGFAVTLEFLGPLSVALVGAVHRRRRRAGAPWRARGSPQPAWSCSPARSRRATCVGLGLGLTAALCWAGYILLNRTLGQRLPGVAGSAVAGALSALVYVPIGIATLLAHPPTPTALACAAAAGVLSSVVPFLADLLALRRVPAPSFGIFMSVSPLLAAAVGAIVLGETFGPLDWMAIGLIVTANAVAVSQTSTTTDSPLRRPPCPSAWSPPAARRPRTTRP